MTTSEGTITVLGEGGWRGTLLPAPADPFGDDGTARYRVHLDEGGTALRIPAALFVRQPNGSYYLPLRRDDAERFADAFAGGLDAALPVTEGDSTAATGLAVGESIVVPVVEERLRVGKQHVETGRVRVTKTITEREEVIDEPLLRETVTIERVPFNTPLAGPDAVPPVRQEGDTMIIPVIEEVIVVEKRLVLKEELHVTRHTATVHDPTVVILRWEEAVVERIAAAHEVGTAAAVSALPPSNRE